MTMKTTTAIAMLLGGALLHPAAAQTVRATYTPHERMMLVFAGS
jgi:hypothetical protein